MTESGRAVWLTERLWELARDLPIVRMPIEADLTHPVILSSGGRLTDDGHRLCKAWMSGETEVNAVRFVIDPAPDYTEPG